MKQLIENLGKSIVNLEKLAIFKETEITLGPGAN